jgi:hypothetical protein
VEGVAGPPRLTTSDRFMNGRADGSRYIIPTAIVIAVVAGTAFLLYMAFFGVVLD